MREVERQSQRKRGHEWKTKEEATPCLNFQINGAGGWPKFTPKNFPKILVVMSHLLPYELALSKANNNKAPLPRSQCLH